jgi:hypothetical protein
MLQRGQCGAGDAKNDELFRSSKLTRSSWLASPIVSASRRSCILVTPWKTLTSIPACINVATSVVHWSNMQHAHLLEISSAHSAYSNPLSPGIKLDQLIDWLQWREPQPVLPQSASQICCGYVNRVPEVCRKICVRSPVHGSR